MNRVLDLDQPDFDWDREVAAMRRNMEAMKSWFPRAEDWEGAQEFNLNSYAHWKLPVHMRLLNDGSDRGKEIQREVLQRLVDLVPTIASNRPDNCPYAVVLGLIEWPALFWSEICVCFTPEKAHGLSPEFYGQPQSGVRKVYSDGSWHEPWDTDETPFNALGIHMPPGVEVGGYKVRRFDPDLDEEITEQFWSIRANAHVAQGEIQ
jgi:hypothetical protein